MESDTPRTDALVDEGGMPYDADFARKLERELAAMRQQRDEARRNACAFEGIIKFNERHPKGIISPEAMLSRARAIAAERGWDCFKEGGGA